MLKKILFSSISGTLASMPLAAFAHSGGVYQDGELKGCHHDNVNEYGIVHCDNDLDDRDAREAAFENSEYIESVCERYGADFLSVRHTESKGMSDNGYAVITFPFVKSLAEKKRVIITFMCFRETWHNDFSCTAIQANGYDLDTFPE